MAPTDRSKVSSTTSGRTRRPIGSVLATIVGTFAMLACTVGVSAAATKSADVRPAARVATAVVGRVLVPRRATASTSTFCTDAANTQKSNPSAAAADSASSLQADYNKLKAEEPTILGLVPSQIRGDYQTIFNWFNKFYAELASVHYDFMKLSPTSLEALSSSNQKAITAASQAIEAYVKKVCGVTH